MLAASTPDQLGTYKRVCAEGPRSQLATMFLTGGQLVLTIANAVDYSNELQDDHRQVARNVAGDEETDMIEMDALTGQNGKFGAEEMLDCLKGYGDATSQRAIYEGLLALDYVPNAPDLRNPRKSQERYISWSDPIRGGPTVIRFTATNLWFIRREDLVKANSPLGTLTDDGHRKHNANFEIAGHTVAPILEAARRVKFP
jgi:hypothetical protein